MVHYLAWLSDLLVGFPLLGLFGFVPETGFQFSFVSSLNWVRVTPGHPVCVTPGDTHLSGISGSNPPTPNSPPPPNPLTNACIIKMTTVTKQNETIITGTLLFADAKMHVSETHNYFSFFTKLLSSNYTLHVNCKQSTISPLCLTILSRGQISHVVHARMF